MAFVLDLFKGPAKMKMGFYFYFRLSCIRERPIKNSKFTMYSVQDQVLLAYCYTSVLS